MLNILNYLDGDDSGKVERLAEHQVIHVDQLIPAHLARASFLKNAVGMALLNSQFSKKEERLQEAAKYYISCGKIREYCEIHFELKNYAKALAFAPAVSIEYWQELSERRSVISQ